jgi:hypothetical protein
VVGVHGRRGARGSCARRGAHLLGGGRDAGHRLAFLLQYAARSPATKISGCPGTLRSGMTMHATGAIQRHAEIARQR